MSTRTVSEPINSKPSFDTPPFVPSSALTSDQKSAHGLPRLVADYRGHVFPAIHGNGPVDRHVVTRAMSRIRVKLNIDNATAHDLRRTGASMMASERCGVRGEVIARILNHTPLGSPVTQIYNRYDYAAEKRAALDLWAETLLKISAAKQGPQNG